MLVDLKMKEFLDELASSSPAPGGGAVAALNGALGAALVSMVCNLTIGKERFADVEEDAKKILSQTEELRKKLQENIEKDAEAFNQVMAAFRMPKETEEQKQRRSEAIQRAYKIATDIPLETAKLCFEVLPLAKDAAKIGNPNAISDIGAGVLSAYAGLQQSLLNVDINLPGIKDTEYKEKVLQEVEKLKKDAETLVNEVLELVKQKI